MRQVENARVEDCVTTTSVCANASMDFMETNVKFWESISRKKIIYKYIYTYINMYLHVFICTITPQMKGSYIGYRLIWPMVHFVGTCL